VLQLLGKGDAGMGAGDQQGGCKVVEGLVVGCEELDEETDEDEEEEESSLEDVSVPSEDSGM
jgi:hypothetical protein